ncbi:TPA: RNA-binding S4 domain-containing protein [Vibrio alginolyticus]|uniref:RNA-binding S4 domain-containing protein n=1 Tax=Vibrio TaxID=662 RepID=UPI001EEACF56|nr:MULTISPECIES: RNA-binding S4 domain-containing protein [Vibrio]EKZ9010942.1 RNA-binding S4 domain-containing protein [Vibrio alginolyticus]ELB2751869.1 RNA-binding S4 domain-containing protein [Vibrio alginolyticus]MCG6356248.1 RNA-binding S4 domain-containing protein [Vibrio alginolyticus]MDW1461970.1 RNA-binding S4 domain-containing protein [Vibrio sp. YT-16]WMO20064.1 RNA-binding S4 domain-containing protein [Vibrio alginolyticus]
MTQDYDHEEYLEGEEIEIEAIGIDVDAHPIELYKLFKIANLVSGGGEAKHIIEEGYVAVNGELETRKRRKMYDGDFFEFNQEYYVVVCDAPVTEPETAEQKAEKKAKKEAQPSRKDKSRQSKSPKASGPKSTGRKAAHKERKAQKEALSQSAKKGKKEDKPQATRDPKSGRNSIDFF